MEIQEWRLRQSNLKRELEKFYKRDDLVDCLLCLRPITKMACKAVREKRSGGYFAMATWLIPRLKCIECRGDARPEREITRKEMVQIRKKAGMNQEQFARVIGVNRSAISNIETGRTELSKYYQDLVKRWLKNGKQENAIQDDKYVKKSKHTF